MNWVARALLAVAAIMATRIAMRRRAHAPVAVLLLASVVLDSVRDLCPMPPWRELVYYLAIPALSAACALRVLQEAPWSFCATIGIIVWGTPLLGAFAYRYAWATVSLNSALVSCGVQVVAAVAWWQSKRIINGTSACVLVMLIGDCISIIGPVGLGGPWWIADALTLLVGVALIALQVAWFWGPWAENRWLDAEREGELVGRWRQRRRR
jgi:hypothetical protein